MCRYLPWEGAAFLWWMLQGNPAAHTAQEPPLTYRSDSLQPCRKRLMEPFPLSGTEIGVPVGRKGGAVMIRNSRPAWPT